MDEVKACPLCGSKGVAAYEVVNSLHCSNAGCNLALAFKDLAEWNSWPRFTDSDLLNAEIRGAEKMFNKVFNLLPTGKMDSNNFFDFVKALSNLDPARVMGSGQ